MAAMKKMNKKNNKNSKKNNKKNTKKNTKKATKLGGLLMLTNGSTGKATKNSMALAIRKEETKFPAYEKGLSTTEKNLRRVYQNQWKYCRNLVGEGRFHVYFGAFGTGILGIRKGKEADFAKNYMEDVPATEEPLKTDVLDKKTGKYRRAKLGSSFIVLFLAHSKYNDSYDASTETLNWMSQRSDCQNNKINFIESECSTRRAIVVIVDKSQDYKTIGVATKFAIKSKAKMNSKEGTMCYFDSKVYHSDKNCEKVRRDEKKDKPIANLRSLKHAHIEDALSAKRGAPCCSNCMWTPPKAKITFETKPCQETVADLIAAASNEHDVFRRGVTRKGKSPYHDDSWVELDRETRRSKSAARKEARLAKSTSRKMNSLVSAFKSKKQLALPPLPKGVKKGGKKSMALVPLNQGDEWEGALVPKQEVIVKTKMIKPKDISELPLALKKKFEALNKTVAALKKKNKKSVVPAGLMKKYERLNEKVAEFRKPQDVSELPAHLKKKFERMIAKVAEYKKPGCVAELPAALKKKFEKLTEKVSEFKRPESVEELPAQLKYKYVSLLRQLTEKQEENRQLIECLPKPLKELREKGEVEEPIFVRGYYRTAHGAVKKAKKKNKKVKKMDPKKAAKVIKAKELARKKLAAMRLAKVKKIQEKKKAKAAKAAAKSKVLAIKN